MATWEEIRDEVAGMLADGKPLEDVIRNLEKRKNEMAKANLLKAMDEMKKREQTKAELDKKWENTVWDTDVYLDDIDGKVPMTNEEWLRSATTEQLAEFVVKAMILYDNSEMTVLEAIKNAVKNDVKLSDYFMKSLLEWLKQPHNKEE